MQFSVAVRNARADAFETAIGTAALLRFYNAAMPVNCASANSGTVLASLTLPSDWMSAASNGVKAKLGTWQDLSADATGFARHFRLFNSAGTVCHAQGLVSEAWVTGFSYSVGQSVHVNTNVYVCTTAGVSGTTGPSGTGVGIVDGSCVWSYVGARGMVIDTTSFVATQSVSVITFQFTEGNA